MISVLKTMTRYWGEEVCTEDEDPVASLENFAIFAVSQFQYIILVIVFSKGAPYRESIFKNRPLLVSWDVYFFLKIVILNHCSRWTWSFSAPSLFS